MAGEAGSVGEAGALVPAESGVGARLGESSVSPRRWIGSHFRVYAFGSCAFGFYRGLFPPCLAPRRSSQAVGRCRIGLTPSGNMCAARPGFASFTPCVGHADPPGR